MCPQVFKWRTLIFSHVTANENMRQDVLEVVENVSN